MQLNIPKTFLLFLAASIFSFYLPAQNLVLNPGFESNSGICLFSGYGNLNNWYFTDTCSSPDQFATCNLLGAPGNGQGNQAPHGGQAYGGFIAYDATYSGYREYVAGELSTALAPGTAYCVSFFISLSDNSSYAVQKVGVYFSNSKVVYNVGGDCISNPTILPYTPQLSAPAGALADKTNWVHVTFTYTATGGEKFITIGNFYNNANSGVSNVGGTSIWAYYYIDDVSVIPGPCGAVASISQTSINCAGTCNGSATASMSNGTAPYTYLWNNGQTTQSINNLCAGNYTVTITDGTSQTATATATIAPGTTSIGASTTVSNATCNTANGSATATGSGGLFYNYLWSNNATSETISGVGAGTYTVTVTEPLSGCTASANAVISVSGGFTATPSSTNTTCGNSIGSATANASGAGPYTYLWSNNGSTATINNLAAGNYTVTISDGGGCSVTGSATVGVTNNLSVTSSSVNSTCNGSNGSATATVTSGTGPYSYLWSINATSQTISNIPAGTYGVTVTGAGGCTATAVTTVTSANNLAVTTSTSDATCGLNNGSATVTVNGGGSYTYIWSNNGTSATISNLTGGNYTVTVLGGAGCSATAGVTITAGSGLSLTTAVTDAVCGNNNGSITVNPGGAGYSYVWSNSETTQSISSLFPGVYSVTVTGPGGCSATASAGITSAGGLTAGFTITQPTCGNSNGSAVCNGVQNGAGNVTTEWLLNGLVVSNSLSVTNIDSGTYHFHAIDSNGCELDTSFTFGSAGVNGVVITADKTLMCSGDTAELCAPAGYAGYLWNTGETTPCIKTVLAQGYYLTVTDNGNCTATSNRINIAVKPLPPVSVSVNADTLTVFSAVSVQWYLNGNAIPGATDSIYVAKQNGLYSVSIEGNNGCVAMSNPVSVVLTGVDDFNPGALRVYPNPAVSHRWYLEVTDNLVGKPVEIFDEAGRLIYREIITQLRTPLGFNAAQGVYILKLNTGHTVFTQRLIKL